MKKILVGMLAFVLMLSSVGVYAASNDFSVLFSELTFKSESSGAVREVKNITPSNSSTEISIGYSAHPNGNLHGDSYYLEASANRYVEYTFNVAKEGIYTAGISFITDTQTGIFQITIDGICVGLPVDTNSAKNSVETMALVSKDLGKIALKAGEHTIRVTCLGMSQSHNYTLFYMHEMKFAYEAEYSDAIMKTYEVEDQTLAFLDQQSGNAFSHDTFEGKVYQMDMKTYKAYSFDITVDTAGEYLLDVGYLADWNCVYADILVDGNKVGTVNTQKLGGWSLSKQAVAVLNLSDASHKITLQYNAEKTAENLEQQPENLYNSYFNYVTLRLLEAESKNPDTGDNNFAILAFVAVVVAVMATNAKKKFIYKGL